MSSARPHVRDLVLTIVLTFGLALLVAVLSVVPARAHGSATAAVPVLEQTTPALPDGVEVTFVASQVASIMEVTNDTDEVVELASEDGDPWLRIGPDGVEVASGQSETYATASPTGGGIPSDVEEGEREDRWVRVFDEPRWSWFEHRLHPEDLVIAPAEPGEEPAATREVATWEVPLTVGGTEHLLSGRLELRRTTGAVTAALTEDAPEGLSVELLSGPVPGLLVELTGGVDEAIFRGIEDEPYLRFVAGGLVEVNTASATYRTNRMARGETADALDAEAREPSDPTWETVATNGRHAWSEGRARPPIDLPEDVRGSDERVELLTWELPVEVDGRATALVGATSWTPLETLGEEATGRRTGPGVTVWLLVLGGAGLLVGLGLRARARV